MMDIKERAILLLYMLEVLGLVQALEDHNVEHTNLFKEDCDSMLVSNAGATKGKAIFVNTTFEICLLQI